MSQRLNNKDSFREQLYKENFDKIVIFEDGDWTKDEMANGKFGIERRHFYDLSKEDTKYISKLVELVLNDVMKPFEMQTFNYSSSRGVDSREDIQSLWEKNIK